MIKFIPSILRVIISGIVTAQAFLRHLGQAVIEVQENRAKLEAEVFCRYNQIVSQTKTDHAISR
jgi:hypothetical protein